MEQAKFIDPIPVIKKGVKTYLRFCQQHANQGIAFGWIEPKDIKYINKK